MKMKNKNICKIALAIVITGTIGLAQADQKSDTLRTSLSRSPIAEVPAKAAELVSQAKAADRDAVAVEVVKLVVRAHPTMTVATVGLISARCPESAGTAAAAAAKLQPKQATLIAKAAAAAAPAQAGAIVQAVGRVVSNRSEVALAVSEAAPDATLEILNSLKEIMPSLKASIDAVIASFNGSVPSVAAVYYRVNSAATGSLAGNSPTVPTSAGSGLRGPTITAPYVPLVTTPAYVPPGSGTVVSPGGRDYAAP